MSPSLPTPAGELGDEGLELMSLAELKGMQVAPCGELASPNLLPQQTRNCNAFAKVDGGSGCV